MRKYQNQIVVTILLLIFTSVFLRDVKLEFRLIFNKDLLAHDESSNSVVAANITRNFFPPMVRVNPLDEKQGNWMEGPYWQHIPPLFTYVPYLFFKLDEQVSIEVKRLSYAFVIWITGLLFITVVYRYKKSLLATFSAFIACLFWIKTPFLHELITGYAFGTSDIVLAFTIVCTFGVIIWYLRGEPDERRQYPAWKLMFIGAMVALPIIAKNLLGAIPAATFFVLLLRDQWPRRMNGFTKFLNALIGFFGLLLLYYLPLYFSSPQTFKNEVFVSFYHFKSLEGWARPWHWYITNYLPQRYLFSWVWVYYIGLVVAIAVNIWWWTRKREGRKYRTTLVVALSWFVWNLIAISLVTSKVPNFIFQSYLLSLFFVIYSLGLFAKKAISTPDLIRGPFQKINFKWLQRLILIFLAVSIFFTGYEAIRFTQQFKLYRAQAYDYQSEHEKFYQVAEQLKAEGVNEQDLVLVFDPPNDCWFRYYILFLTGAESKTLLEMHFLNFPTIESDIQKKYQQVYFVDQSLKIIKFDINKLNELLDFHATDFETEILRIKKDKQSCQWLVPDAILNAL